MPDPDPSAALDADLANVVRSVAVGPEKVPIHVALNRVFAEVPPVGKDEENKQQGFRFRGVDAMEDALRGLFAKHGIVPIPISVVENVRSERTTRSGSVMYASHVTMRYRFYGPAGDYLDGESIGEAADSGDKATPKALTASWKSLLDKMFLFSEKGLDQDHTTPEETVDWYIANGWEGGETAAREWKKSFVDRLRQLPAEQAAAFKEWRVAKNLELANVWTFPEAQEAEAKAAELVAVAQAPM